MNYLSTKVRQIFKYANFYNKFFKKILKYIYTYIYRRGRDVCVPVENIYFEKGIFWKKYIFQIKIQILQQYGI